MKQPFQVLYEDESMVILDKPAGLLTIPDRLQPTLPNLHQLLKARYPQILTVHRLDRDTSGAICFARTERAHQLLSGQFAQRTVEKLYLALVEGRIGPDEGVIDLHIGPHPRFEGKMMTATQGGKSARTDYQVLERFVAFTWVQARLHTGRTHQVRVHFLGIGHPLAVDALYGPRKALFLSEIKGKRYNLSKGQEELPLLGRTPLHASVLALDHPITGERIRVEAPLPKDLRAVLSQLSKWGA